MTAAELVAGLQERGVSLAVSGAELRCRPRSRLTPNDLAHLRDMKSEVLALLRSPRPTTAAAPVVCFGCRERSFWRSIYGVVICAVCHPPADESLVVEHMGEGVHAK